MKTLSIVRLVLIALGLIAIVVGIVLGMRHKKETGDFNSGWNYYLIGAGVFIVLVGMAGEHSWQLFSVFST